MNRLNPAAFGEAELAELNARADAAVVDGDDAWDDVVRAAEHDCATLRQSLLSCAGAVTE
jgi:hypothetical protein